MRDPYVCPCALQDVYVNVSRIMSLGNRLLELGHTSAQQIQQLSGQLEQEWRAFAAALDERSSLLEGSAAFHHRAEQVSTKATYPSGLGNELRNNPNQYSE